MLHGRRAFGKERKEPGLKNWQQMRYVCAAVVYKILCYNATPMCVWRRLGVRHKRLGVVKGVWRRALPRRLKNIDTNNNFFS
jgi:D-mannonate dehydratase